jgi:hypothetical protein
MTSTQAAFTACPIGGGLSMDSGDAFDTHFFAVVGVIGSYALCARSSGSKSLGQCNGR